MTVGIRASGPSMSPDTPVATKVRKQSAVSALPWPSAGTIAKPERPACVRCCEAQVERSRAALHRTPRAVRIRHHPSFRNRPHIRRAATKSQPSPTPPMSSWRRHRSCGSTLCLGIDGADMPAFTLVRGDLGSPLPTQFEMDGSGTSIRLVTELTRPLAIPEDGSVLRHEHRPI